MVTAVLGARLIAAVTPEELQSACGHDPSPTCEKVLEWTGSARAATAADWFVAKPLTIAVIFLVAFIANRIARALIKRGMNRMLDPSPGRATSALRKATPALLQRTASQSLRAEARVQTLTTVLRGLATIAIYFIALLEVLEVLDVNLAPLIASAGILGVALGFGAQNIVRDFLAGTFFVLEDQFGVGDIVDLGGEAKGTVEKITLRATRLRDVNGTVWHVPNGQVQRVANKSQEWARAVLEVEVDGDNDYAEVAAVLQHVADTLAAEDDWRHEVLAPPEVWGIEAFTPEGYCVRVVVKTPPASQFPVMRELRIRWKAACREAGIILPGERPELWVHDGADGGSAPAPPRERGPEPGPTPDAEPGRQPHPPRGDPAESG